MSEELPPKTLVCSLCNKRKKFESFVNNKQCKWGKQRRCKPCAKQYQRQHYKQNAEAVKQYQRQYYKQNAEAVKQYNKQHYKQNAEAIKQYKKQNAEAIKQRVNQKYRTCTQFKLRTCIRNALRRALTQGGTKKYSSLKYPGCSIETLKEHLEKQFEPGMTWDNWSHAGWHIDHIKPLASFDLTDEKQLRKACHYTNLQPMWAEENLAKGARYSGRKETKERKVA